MSPIAILISAFIGANIALQNIKSARQIAREKATLDLIEKTESTEFYRENHSVFRDRRLSNTIMRLTDPKSEADRRDRARLYDYLNHYELISIGIRKNILDEDFYKNWMRTAFLRDWEAAAEFIQRERWKQKDDTEEWEYNAKLFEHYNELAHQWTSKEIPILKAESSSPPSRPAGPGDQPVPGIEP